MLTVESKCSLGKGFLQMEAIYLNCEKSGLHKKYITPYLSLFDANIYKSIEITVELNVSVTARCE